MECQLSPQTLPTEPDGGHPALKEPPSQGGGLRLELLYGGGHASDPIWPIASCRPCPTLLQAGPSACWPQAPVLSRPFSLKPCPAKCEILPTPPSSPGEPQRLFWGLPWHGMLCPPAGPGMAMQEVHSVFCLTSPGQALSWPVCAQLCCRRLTAAKSRHPDQVVPSLALGL